MNVVTRGDWDGLVSCVILGVVEDIGGIRFVHPKDVQDGLVEAGEEDIVVNVPYIEGCGLWFDHHISEQDRITGLEEFNGRFEVAPSCARVIYNHYVEADPKNAGKLQPYEVLLEAADKLDSAQLTIEDVTDPRGWVLLGYTVDPRSGLGSDFRQYFCRLVEHLKEQPSEKVMQHRDVKRRCDRVRSENEEYRKFMEKHAWADENVIVVDLRGVHPKPVGPRFVVFTMFPDANVEVRVFDGIDGKIVMAVGRSIFNRTCTTDIGHLMREYGGGGHAGAGSTQLPDEGTEARIREIVGRLKE
jgi:hypothetical protein